MKLIILKSVLLLFVFSSISCEKYESDGDVAIRNEQELSAFITKKGWTATKLPEGIYIVNDGGGTGSATPTANSNVTVKYKGYFLDESTFDQSENSNFNLYEVIDGWRIGFQKFQKGTKGKLLIPAAYAYKRSGRGSIPSNTALIFEVELINFK